MGIVSGSYRYTRDLLSLESHHLHLPPSWCTLAPSPLNLDVLRTYFRRHPDTQYAAYLAHGLQHGFHIGFSRTSVNLRSAPRNHPSSLERTEVVTNHIQEEWRTGRLSGPIPQVLTTQVHISPIGLVPKPHSDRWRLIVDLSSPWDHSVNDRISSSSCSIQYASIDNAVDIITHLGCGTLLVKLDLANAYRIVPVHPDDQLLLGIQWRGSTFIDRSLPFGLRSSPKIFNAIADLLTWSLHCEGIQYVIHYLDDFLVFVPPGSNDIPNARSKVEAILSHVGAPIAHHKTEGPASVVTFLGIQNDTDTQKLSLPIDKTLHLQRLLQQWRMKKSCTRKELESFVGHLSHAATIIRPGRIFLRNLYSLLSRVSNPSHFVCLNVNTRTDIAWWHSLLQHWNGHSFFPQPTPSHHLFSDASGSFGCGAICPEMNTWCQLQWPEAWDEVGIAAKELVPIVLAAALWGPNWSRQHILFHSDNEAVVTIIQKRHAKHQLINELLRCLFFYASIFHFNFSATHIPGVLNVAADAISRNNLTLLSSLFPQATQTLIHNSVSAFLLHLPQWGSPAWMEQFNLSLQRVFPALLPVATSRVSSATPHSVPHTTSPLSPSQN